VDSLPRVVDRYELLAVLGSGGFAVVYRARHIHTRQIVAMKILEKRSGVERFIGEARAAAAVQHRNVVRVLDCGQATNTGEVFIVMELVEGQTLADVLHHHGPLPPQRAVDIAIQILDGLSAAHACGIVHRDIKPPNVFLTRDTDGTDLPKILDFGVSKQLTAISGTLDGTAIGTPGYMAPELFGSAKHADARADVYAVAVTLYEMLSGRLPFSASSYEELVVQVATQRPAPIAVAAPHVPAPIAACVDRGLARDREARFQSAEAFASALRGALLGIPPPSSHQFEATLDAQHASVSVPGVPASLAAPEPSTLRTAPPPVVNTASRAESRSRGVLGYVVALVAIVLVASGGGAFAVWRVMTLRGADHATQPPSSESSSPSALVAANEANATSDAPSAAREIEPLAVAATTAPSATALPQAARGARSPGGIRFTETKIVGTARYSAVAALEAYVVPRAQRCRPDGSTPVVTQLDIFIGSESNITLAHQTPNTTGDAIAAACLAEVFKKSASPATWTPNGSGIATVEATLDPR